MNKPIRGQNRKKYPTYKKETNILTYNKTHTNFPSQKYRSLKKLNTVKENKSKHKLLNFADTHLRSGKKMTDLIWLL